MQNVYHHDILHIYVYPISNLHYIPLYPHHIPNDVNSHSIPIIFQMLLVRAAQQFRVQATRRGKSEGMSTVQNVCIIPLNPGWLIGIPLLDCYCPQMSPISWVQV